MNRSCAALAIAIVILTACMCAAASESPLTLLGDYEIERFYNLGVNEDLRDWCLDDPTEGMVIEATTDGVFVSGYSEPIHDVQPGIQSIIPLLASVKSLESAVRVEVRSRETAVVLGLMSLDVRCSMAQVRCSPGGFSFNAVEEPCPNPHVYPETDAGGGWLDDMPSPGVYTLRFIYDSGRSRLKGYRGERFIGAESVHWSPGNVEIRIFGEASASLQGKIDVTFLEIAIGWDPSE